MGTVATRRWLFSRGPVTRIVLAFSLYTSPTVSPRSCTRVYRGCGEAWATYFQVTSIGVPRVDDAELVLPRTEVGNERIEGTAGWDCEGTRMYTGNPNIDERLLPPSCKRDGKDIRLFESIKIPLISRATSDPGDQHAPGRLPRKL